MTPFGETTPAQFDLLFDVHVKGVFFLTQALAPLLADGGRIVNFSSGLTRITYPGFSAYSAAKGAVEVLTAYLAKELGHRGVTANTIAPGAIETDFLGGAVRDTPAYNQAFAAMTALGRVGAPDDIGPAVASLLTPTTAGSPPSASKSPAARTSDEARGRRRPPPLRNRPPPRRAAHSRACGGPGVISSAGGHFER